MRLARILAVFVGLLAVGAVGLAAFLKSIDLAEYRDIIAEQVKQATGRDLTLAGEAELAVSLTPTITISDVSFTNAPWGSRPLMVAARRVEAQIELLPLISGNINVKRLVLVEPDILLETDAEGRGNWEFEMPAAETSDGPAATSSSSDAVIPTVREILITGGRLTYKDGQTGETANLVVERLGSGADGVSSPLRVDVAGAYNGNSFSVQGVLGPVAQLAGGAPYPVDLRAQAGGATLTVEGTIGQPMSGKGLDLVIGAMGDDIAAFSPLLGRELPAVGPYDVRLRLTDPEGRYQASELMAEIGKKGGEFLAATGTVDDVVSGTGLDLSLTLEGRELETLGRFVGLEAPPAGPVAATGRLTDPDGRYQVSDLAAEIGKRGEEFLAVTGTVGDVITGTGLDLSLTLEGRELETLGKYVGLEAPPAGPVAATGRLTDPKGRLRISNLAAEIGSKGEEFLAVTGTIRDVVTGTGLNLLLAVEGRELETLGKYVGLEAPPVGPVAATGRLTDPKGRLQISDLAAEIGWKGEEFLAVTGTIRDVVTGTGLDLSLALEGRELETLGEYAGLELPPVGPVAATGKLSDPGRVYSFEDVKATLGESDLEGRVSINFAGARPLFVAEVTSSALDLDALLPSDEQVKGAESNGRAGHTGDRERVFSDEPLPLGELKAADAILSFHGKRVAVEGAVFEDVVLQLSLEEGALAVRLVDAIYGGAGLSADISIDSRPAVPTLEAHVNVMRLDMGRLLSAMRITERVEAESDIAVRVHGSGASVRAIMGGLTGDATLVMGEGRIDSSSIDFLAADLVQAIGPAASNDGHTNFNCFVSRFVSENGLATSRGILFDTQRITVVGEGEINLGSEELDLVLKPKPKDPSLISLATPILVGGTLADPSVGPDTLAVAKDAAGAVIGAAATGGIGLILPFLSAGSADKSPCIAAVAEARSRARQTAGTFSPAAAEDNESGDGGLEGLLEDVGNAIRGLFESN